MKESNEEFRQTSPLEQLFHHCFQVAEEGDGEWYTTMQIFSCLQKNTREKFSNGKVVILGRLLQQLGVPSKRSRSGTVYYLRKSAR